MNRQEKVEAMEEIIIDALGAEGTLGEIIRALSTDQKRRHLPIHNAQ